MDLAAFVRRIRGFDDFSHPDKIRLFAWFLHVHFGRDRIDQDAVRGCYRALSMEANDVARDMRRLTERKPPSLLKDRRGFYLAGPIRRQLDKLYLDSEMEVEVSQFLSDLLGKVPDETERMFLSEALTCYKYQAYRAAIVMTWNLAYDHLIRWVAASPQRLVAFNGSVVARIGSKRGTGLSITARDDFMELKEHEVIDICGSSGILPSRAIKQVLNEQLTRRNIAAHPSMVEIRRSQADDTITTLVNNVVLKLK